MRRLIFIVAIFLLAGLAVNVAVAWAMAWASMHYNTDDRPLRALRWYLLWIRPGLALNTLHTAAVGWLLIYGPLALNRLIRRFIRIRRGLCPACAYPRGASDVCSECGTAIPSRKVTAT
ncbi:MAG: hypothetical protein E2O40_01500 [Planctomycetota bacterium]|nr:MAG: hypothetical protein E2O40_01500 [Planctomycetota bacterium]